MAIKSKSEMSSEIEIDLTGPDGNAFALMGLAQNLAKQLEYDGNKRGKLTADMMSGDYEHLLEVFEKHFGSFITLYR
ncbi:hypothetical protein H8D83_02370 [Candidatus Woesearchaeota archaeon]|nr:hypothetical protein [Candidatus Woesearchaeota archaeon]